MIYQSPIKSPMGFYYKYDRTLSNAERLTRRTAETGPYSVGMPSFSIALMTPGELEHIARVMRAGGE